MDALIKQIIDFVSQHKQVRIPAIAIYDRVKPGDDKKAFQDMLSCKLSQEGIVTSRLPNGSFIFSSQSIFDSVKRISQFKLE